jgi:hypothetical protein
LTFLESNEVQSADSIYTLLELLARRLTPFSDTFVGNAAAEITVLLFIAERLDGPSSAPAHQAIMSAVAVLRERMP